ncbi:MAG: hypothetical protein M3Y87_20265 [Myxococcota bacterium]|nr:hypothetical protein [Myxococcota bacterium]
MRTLGSLLSLSMLVAGCTASHTRGDHHDAAAPDDVASATQVGPPCVPVLVPEGGFARTEVSVETYTPSCGEPPFEGVPTRPPIGVCVVYGLGGDPRPGCTSGCARPEDIAERTFCTCRCGGDPGTGPFCTCSSGARCERLVAHGGRSGGSFCVPVDLPPL